MKKEDFEKLKVGDQIRPRNMSVFFVVTGWHYGVLCFAQKDMDLVNVQTTTVDECEDWIKVK